MAALVYGFGPVLVRDSRRPLGRIETRVDVDVHPTTLDDEELRRRVALPDNNLALGEGPIERDELRAALVASTVSASFTLESFGVAALQTMSEEAFDARIDEFESILR